MKKILSAAILIGVFVAGMLVASIPFSTLQAEAVQDDAPQPQSLAGRLASVEKVLQKTSGRLNSINEILEPGDVPPDAVPAINGILDLIKSHLSNMQTTVDQIKAKVGP